jgi:peptide/nickel transport system substrate-binding protein
MTITWRIRDNARWHDGTPFTAADLLFTAQVVRDRDLPEFRDPAFDSIADVQAPDPRTIVVTWTRPYIRADAMFSPALAMPMQKRALEQAYTENKAAFTEQRYFNTEFVGAGPYRVKEWARGSHMVLEANGDYALGRPKIDEIEIRFIPDPTALVAVILSGAIDLTLSSTLSLEQALQLRDQWSAGHVEMTYAGWFVAYPQFVDPNPAIIGDVRFRRALMYALDRQQLVDNLMAGLSAVADSYVPPSRAEYPALAPSIVRYEYDAARARGMLEALGYTRGADGMLRDSANQPLMVEANSTTNDANVKVMLAVADFWKQVGVGVDPVVIPPQRAADQEYRSTFPGFAVQNQSNSIADLSRLHGREARTAENRFAGGNNARYMNPEFDALIDRFFAAIPQDARTQVLAQIIRHMGEQLNVMPLVYQIDPNVIANRMVNAGPKGEEATQAWNAATWDVKSR